MGTRKVPFSRELYIEQDDFREDPPKELLPPGARARKCGCATATSSRCVTAVKDPADGRGRRGALHLRSGHPRRQHARRPQGQRHDPLGLGRTRGRRPRCGSTTTSSPSPIPNDVPEGHDYKVNLNPNSLTVVSTAAARAEPGGGQARRSLPVRAAGLFLRRSERFDSPARRSSTARCRCATRGRRSRRKRRRSRRRNRAASLSLSCRSARRAPRSCRFVGGTGGSSASVLVSSHCGRQCAFPQSAKNHWRTSPQLSG